VLMRARGHYITGGGSTATGASAGAGASTSGADGSALSNDAEREAFLRRRLNDRDLPVSCAIGPGSTGYGEPERLPLRLRREGHQALDRVLQITPNPMQNLTPNPGTLMGSYGTRGAVRDSGTRYSAAVAARPAHGSSLDPKPARAAAARIAEALWRRRRRRNRPRLTADKRPSEATPGPSQVGIPASPASGRRRSCSADLRMSVSGPRPPRSVESGAVHQSPRRSWSELWSVEPP
jgi:hypothetical protein